LVGWLVVCLFVCLFVVCVFFLISTFFVAAQITVLPMCGPGVLLCADVPTVGYCRQNKADFSKYANESFFYIP
jgi:hypothetical protein